jgi:hypothetical protein
MRTYAAMDNRAASSEPGPDRAVVRRAVSGDAEYPARDPGFNGGGRFSLRGRASRGARVAAASQPSNEPAIDGPRAERLARYRREPTRTDANRREPTRTDAQG